MNVPIRTLTLALLAVACLAPACSIFTSESAREAEALARKEIEDQVRTLRKLTNASMSLSAQIGRRVAAEAKDLALKRESVVSRQRFTDEAMTALWLDPPLLGLLDLWALVLQFQAFAPLRIQQIPALAPECEQAIAELLTEIETEMQRILPVRFADAKKAIVQFAAARPIRDGFIRIGVTHSMLGDAETSGMFAWIPEVKLNPFSSVGEGLGESAVAIQSIGRSVDRFTDLVNALPLRLAWQLEMFNYQLAGDAQFNAISSGFAETAKAANAAVAAIETAPGQIRTQVVAAFDDLDPKLAEVRATLAEVKTASDSLTPSAQAIDAAAKSLGVMAAQLDATLKTFNQTFTLLGGDPNAPPPPEAAPSHPFDVREFDAAGRSMTAMAAQLQQTLASLRELIRDPALTERLDQASGSATSTVQSIVWSAVGGGLALAAGLALVFAGYRRFARQTR